MERRKEHRLNPLRICEPLPTHQPVVQAEAAITRRGCVVEAFRGARLPEEGGDRSCAGSWLSPQGSEREVS